MTASMGAKSMQQRPAGIITRGIVLLSLVTSLSLLVTSLSLLVAALASAANAQESETADSSPLVVPIFPRSDKDKKDPSPDSENKMPAGADLRDSYIILEDGNVMSMADWVLGGLSKNQTGAGMSDFQNRLFLGQVARAMAGQSEKMVHDSVVDVGPLRTYHPGRRPSLASQLGQFVLAQFMPGLFFDMPDDYDPAKVGGGFDPRKRTEGDAAILFEEQFSEAYFWSNGEFHDRGVMKTMLRDYQRKKQAGTDD